MKIFMFFESEIWVFGDFHRLYWNNYGIPKSSNQRTLTIWQLQKFSTFLPYDCFMAI